MTEKTAQQIEKDKEAVDAMKYAQAKMKIVLERNATLTQELSSLVSSMSDYAKHLPDDLYFYESKNSARQKFTERLNEARKVL